MSNYKRLEKVGEGTYGVVYKAIYKPTKQLVALKKIKLEDEKDGVPPTSLREICVLKELNHPNVVEMIDVILDRTTIYLVFEFLYMDLGKYLRNLSNEGKRIDKTLAISYSYQLCQVILILIFWKIFFISEGARLLPFAENNPS